MKRRESARHLAWVVSAVLAGLGSAVSAEASEPGRGGPSEGIKVHGRWTIEVKNPNGTLDARHEIENALITTLGGGRALLAGLLGNVYTDPKWSMFLWGSPAPCGGPLPVDPCSLTEADLTVTTPMANQAEYAAGTMELSGSVTILVDSTLFDVVSLWSVQRRGSTVRTHGGFTSKGVSIPVRAGQIVQVKVVFSFS